MRGRLLACLPFFSPYFLSSPPSQLKIGYSDPSPAGYWGPFPGNASGMVRQCKEGFSLQLSPTWQLLQILFSFSERDCGRSERGLLASKRATGNMWGQVMLQIQNWLAALWVLRSQSLETMWDSSWCLDCTCRSVAHGPEAFHEPWPVLSVCFWLGLSLLLR